MNLRITTFNLFQYCNYNYSFYTKKEKYNKNEWLNKNIWLKETLNEINSDVIGFQEVFSHKDLEILTKNLGYKYFAKIDEAKLNKKVYETCVVSLASKYPIKKIETVEPNLYIVKMFDFEEEFNFQRKPLKVTIEINNLEYIFYVVHLKSNRLNEFEYKFEKTTPLNEKLEKSIESFSFKNTNALKQRLCEAFHLSNDILKEKNQNIILMGDFNDKEFSLTMDILTNTSLIENIKDFKTYQEINIEDFDYQLYDTFYLSKEYEERPNSSYFKTLGNVLDYIFISKNLKKDFISYDFFDSHLKDNLDGSLLNSDHAIVSTLVKL